MKRPATPNRIPLPSDCREHAVLMNIELTPRTAAVVTHYARLLGLEPEEFLNSFLENVSG
jgi:hypothetical protein